MGFVPARLERTDTLYPGMGSRSWIGFLWINSTLDSDPSSRQRLV